MRFSEALELTPDDFDFAHQSLSINKIWNYKSNGGFALTKNKSSVRKIQIDWQTVAVVKAVSAKTVQIMAKGKSMPDAAIMLEVYDILNITVTSCLVVNELTA